MTDETNGSAANAAQLSLQKVYIKDASFEVPGAPHIFQDATQPQIQLNLSQQVGALAENVYEVVLTITVTCKLAEKTAYLAEVQ
jgi:preprotein translocase subunit SecB